MQLPTNKEGFTTEIKVIESKTICYCSNFDLNVNEWFNEYENIEIFKLNVKKNLGKIQIEFITYSYRLNVAKVFSWCYCNWRRWLEEDQGGSLFHYHFKLLPHQLLLSRYNSARDLQDHSVFWIGTIKLKFYHYRCLIPTTERCVSIWCKESSSLRIRIY